jgi:hypothetical protein
LKVWANRMWRRHYYGGAEHKSPLCLHDSSCLALFPCNGARPAITRQADEVARAHERLDARTLEGRAALGSKTDIVAKDSTAMLEPPAAKVVSHLRQVSPRDSVLNCSLK